MADNKIDILLTLNDKATKGLQTTQTKMQTFSQKFKENWLSITAQVTAAVIAINKAFDLAFSAAKFNQQKQAFRNLAASLGADADSIVSKLREMSGQTLSTAQIMQNASRAMILGLSPDKLPKLMEISRAAARAFGEDVNFMFDSIVLGIGRQSRMILDNLGIIVSSQKANEDYALTLGKNVSQLTEAEKKQAFLNATLEAGEKIIGQINVKNKSQFETLKSLGAFWDDLKIKVGNAILAIIQSVGILVNVLRAGMGEAVAKISDSFAFLTEKIVVATRFYGELIDKIPGLNDPLDGISDRLEKQLQLTKDFSEGMRTGADEFAIAALDIVDIMTNEVEPSIRRATESAGDIAPIVTEDMKRIATQTKVMTSTMEAGFTNALSSLIRGVGSAKEVFQELGTTMVKAVVDFVAQQIIAATIGKVIRAGETALLAAMGATVAAAWAPAAAMTSLASFGSNAAPAAAGIASISALTQSLAIPRMAEGGIVKARPGGIIANIGEGGRDEAVIPLDNGMGFGDINIFIQGGINPGGSSIEEMAEKLGFAFEREVRTARG